MSITEDEVEYFAEGQCHALALALLEHLTPHDVPVRLVASWLDPRGVEALAEIEAGVVEDGPAPNPDLTQHVAVITDQTLVDISGWIPLTRFDEYVFDATVGWSSSDMPLLRHTYVTEEWVRALHNTGWAEPDLKRARSMVERVLATDNPDYPA